MAPVAPIETVPIYVYEEKIGPSVTLTRIPEWFKEDREHVRKVLGELRSIDSAACLLATFEANAFGERETASDPSSRSKDRAAIEALQVSLLSLWLTCPSALTFEFVITREPEFSPGGSVISTMSLPGIKPRPRYADRILNGSHIKLANKIASAILQRPRRSAIQTACRFLWCALTEQIWEIRFVNLWIALEAILGPEKDLWGIHRTIPRRLARLLNPDNDKNGQIAYAMAYESNDWRCAFVHGGRFGRLDKSRSESMMLETEGMIMTCLRKILLDLQLLRIFISADRDNYLEKLAKGFQPPKV
jgi:hypothetical protein